MRLALGCAFVAVAASPALAQETASGPEGAQPRGPVLLAQVHDEQAPKALALTQVKTHATIQGFVAQTTTTLTFHNALDRALEGELIFPLPEGSTISGYALDIEGKLVDAVPVEKHEARYVFESEVRKGIDPGLAEWVRGNIFRTRVWPIPARGERTVQVQYVSELTSASDEWVYHLPLRYPAVVERFELTVEVVKADAPPRIRQAALANFSFERWEDRHVAVLRQEHVTLDAELLIAVPARAGDGEPQVFVGTGSDGNQYFAVLDAPHVPAAGQRPSPARIGVIWDASLSRAPADKTREIGILQEHLRQLRDVVVHLVVFRNVVYEPVSFEVTGGDAGPLIDHLTRLPYDGGTNFAALERELGPRQDPGQTARSYDLLFTDGLGTLDDGLPSFDRPVFALSGDARADHRQLRYLAQSSGGRYFNLSHHRDEDVLRGMGVRPFSFTEATYDPRHIAEVYPSTPQPVDGGFVLTGRLLAPEAVITLHYGDDRETTVTVRGDEAAPTGLIPRLWAQMKIDDLSVYPDKNHAELLGVGRMFGMVTPATSLLVLETLEQYVEHRIVPPRSRAEMYARYFVTMEQHAGQEKRQRKEKIEKVLAMWNERVAWWEEEFKYPKGFRFAGDADHLEQLIAEGDDLVLRAEQELERRRVPARGGEEPPRDPGGALFSDPGETRAQPLLEARDEAAGKDVGRRLASILLKEWDPEARYLAALKNAPPGGAYDVYLEQRPGHANSPAFYLDCAEHFFRTGERHTGLRILTSVLELELDSPPLLRVVANRLDRVGELDLAIALFERVLRLRPEEPQSYRDLALVLARRSEYQRAIELYERIVTGHWDDRFPEIEVIALMDLNRVIATVAESENLKVSLDPRLRRILDVDIRVILTWDSDLTDIDLWVIEPSGEKCYYSHNRTTIGGLLSADMTGGYGPEEYLIRKVMPGQYTIKAHFFGSQQERLTGPTTVRVTVVSNHGRPHESRRSTWVRVAKKDDVVEIGRIAFETAEGE